MSEFALNFAFTFAKCLIIIALIATMAGFATYIERKVIAYMQRRLGPAIVGPAGVLQVVADMIKLITKEDTIPTHANKFLYKISPIISAAAALVAISVVPLLPEFSLFGHTIRPIIADINVALLFLLGASAAGVYGLVIGGLASYNKYGLIGSFRAFLQLISFEVINALSLIPIIMIVGSLSLIDIVNTQSGGIEKWFVWKEPVCFALFLIASFVECNRTPLCLTENETELLAGASTAYSGLRGGMFFIGEYANMITYSVVISLIFFGGYNSFWFIPGWVMIALKAGFFFFLFLWSRAAFPHLRPDQLMALCWKVCMPLALLSILITGIVIL
ncbi:NADH-quinone oxidoreductase subunit NuoH [Campylobacter sp. JMF_08 NE1]|uniref:NADH-quinone oxidoreductase subunit NuoH n=1 Tax=Campylobacter sp. JMF_08 NE1 TaxID=2983821 RepID=UPI0022E9FA1E|nr:NADH-quinone oxidoreductase subunit NuoH [Campylobacter sp. JMF_08 NE1]MDA3047796.1 NADH-quinone oxidoreductase subunit NuoH [Campylobacter sp. JMF_08 NE1]